MTYTLTNKEIKDSSVWKDPLIDKIKREYLTRKQKNKSYSQRAYSKSLGLDQSLLSKILRGQWTLSQSLRFKIALKLGLNPLDVGSPPKGQFNKHNNQIEQYKKIEEEVQFLSDWYSFAILEYLKIPNTSFEAAYIAKIFGIKTFEVQDTFERLIHFKFIEKSGDHYIIKSPNNIWSDNVETTLARQQLQKRILEKSLAAIEETNFKHRYHCSLTLSVDQSRMHEFKMKIDEIQKELSEYFQPSKPYKSSTTHPNHESQSSQLNEVYQLQIGFFPLTKNFNK
jgi:uncharacterized protein (TIGR02147 family)